VIIIQCTLRYNVLLWRGRVFIKRCHLKRLVSRKASIFLTIWRLTATIWVVPHS